MNNPLDYTYLFCKKIPINIIHRLISILRQQDQYTWRNPQLYQISNQNMFNIFKELLCLYQTPQELASALDACSYCYKKEQNKIYDFVWTEPNHILKNIRKTEQALLDIINNAHKTLFLVSFASYQVNSLHKELQNALQRGVQISFILESVQDSQGGLSHNADRPFLDLKSAKFYHWSPENRPKDQNGIPSKLHAKCIVNENSFIITSANLTKHAMSKNIELGILSNDSEKATTLIYDINTLIKNNIFSPYIPKTN